MIKLEPYRFAGEPLLLDDMLLLGDADCPRESYDMMDMAIHPLAAEKMDQAARGDQEEFGVHRRNREMFREFRYGRDSREKKIFLFAQVLCEREERTIVHFASRDGGKLWVNGRCQSIQYQPWEQSTYTTCTLHPGENRVLVEVYDPDDAYIFSVQLLGWEREHSGDPRALSNCPTTVELDPLRLIQEYGFVPDKSTFRFLYMQPGEPEVLPDYTVELQDSVLGHTGTLKARLGEPVTLQLEPLRAACREPLRDIFCRCVFTRRDGGAAERGLCVIPRSFDGVCREINDRLRPFVPLLGEWEAENLAGKIDRLDRALAAHNQGDMYWFAKDNLDLHRRLLAGEYRHDDVRREGHHTFYIHSDLDDSYIRISNWIPRGYDPDIPYPVLLYLATEAEGYSVFTFPQQAVGEPCLCFDVGGRGFTGGSYVGEAAILEVLSWIEAHYHIDRERVYLLGASNGGYAAWAVAQYHPHLAAAVFPHTGYPNVEDIRNLANVPVYQLVSPEDYIFRTRENEVKDLLAPYGRYHQIDFQQILHSHLPPYLQHTGILTRMLEARRNLYPDRIDFGTQRNRHDRAYWLRLHGIRFGARHARVQAQVNGPYEIQVQTENLSGLTVQLPPQIDPRRFDIVLDGTRFAFRDFPYTDPHFQWEDGAWRQVEHEPALPDQRKGTGMVDVYTGSMRVVIPKGAPRAVAETARRFCRPCCNGANDHIQVDYPLYEDGETPEHLLGHHLVLLDVGGRNSLADLVRESLPVQGDSRGFTYLGERREGPYAAIQAVANPYDPRRTFLVISASSPEMLKKPIVLRRVVLPTYSNGLHPYWNNELLVYTGGELLAAFEAGEPLRPIPKKLPLMFGRDEKYAKP